MKFYVISDEEIKRLGANPKDFNRIYQWYGQEEFENDIDSGNINAYKDGKRLRKEEMIKIADEMEGTISTGDETWDNLAIDMQYNIEWEAE